MDLKKMCWVKRSTSMKIRSNVTVNKTHINPYKRWIRIHIKSEFI